MRAFLPRRSWSLATLLVGTAVSLSCGGDGGSPSPTPTNVIVTPGADTLVALGETQAFTAAVLDANGDPIDGATVTWSSSDTSVVTILPSGVATARKNGAVTVTATAGVLNGSAPITVAQVPTTVTITPATGVFTFVGDTQTFTAQVLDAGGTPVVPVQRIWTLNDNTVAVIDSNGLARAKGPGIAMVTVVAIGPGGAKAGYAAVSSTQPVASLTFRTQPQDVKAGESMDPAIQAEVRDSGNAVVTGYAGAVTISVDSGPLGATLHGTKTVNAVNGVVSYSGLWLDKAGEYRFKATAATLTPATSGGFAVVASEPARTEIVYDPAQDSLIPMRAGDGINLYVVVQDRFGNPFPHATPPLYLERISGPEGGDVVGDATGVHLGDGLYWFPGATFEKAGTGYRVRAIASGILPDTTEPFRVVGNDPVRFVILHDPTVSVGSVFGAESLVFDVVDAYDNPTYLPSQSIHLSHFGWPYAATPDRGQQLLGGEDLITIGPGPFTFPYFGFSRPGPVGYVLEGDGIRSDSTEMRLRSFLSPVTLSAGGATTCVTGQGFTYCVGANEGGMMGVDPAALPGDSVLIGPDIFVGSAAQVAIGGHHLCRIYNFVTREVNCRGANDEGQLGVVGPGGADFQLVAAGSGVLAITAGDGHTCAILSDSTAACWGRNDHGELGRGSTSAFESAPAAVSGGLKWKSISAGDHHTCGVTSAGAARCWGSNDHGQLGDSTQSDHSAPTAVYGIATWRQVSAGGNFTCGQRSTGFAYHVACWGDNASGQVGVAGGGLKLVPTVPSYTPNNEPVSLATGGAHACVIIEAIVRCWGDNTQGAVGSGAAGGVLLPTVISIPNSTSAWGGEVVAGRAYTCVARGYIPGGIDYAANRVTCWGANDAGQLGDGTTTARAGPVDMIR